MFDLPDRVVGATRTPIEVTWTSDGVAVNLTGATLTGMIRRVSTGESRSVAGSLTVTSAPEGIFQWALDADDVDAAGLYEVQITATYTGANDVTYASLWRVLPELSTETSAERILSRILTSSEVNPDEIEYIRELIDRAKSDVLVACNINEWPDDDHLLETMAVDLALWRYNQTGVEGSQHAQLAGIQVNFGQWPESVKRGIPMKRRLW